MKIADIIHEAHATACEKGWHERPACSERMFVERDEHGILSYVAPRNVDVALVGSWLALIHTELGEAWDAYERRELGLHSVKDKPCGLLSELADVVIRICDDAGALGLPLRADGIDATQETIEDLHTALCWLTPERWTPATLMLDMRSFADFAIEELRKLDWLELCDSLGYLIAQCNEFARLYGDRSMTLTEAVRIKMAYNRTRPHRHGGKAL